MATNKKRKRHLTPKKLSAEEKGRKIMSEPCIYCNSKPVYIGTAVFLKPSFEIHGKYEKQLKYLIQNNHRFVIIGHLGLKKGTCVVCLLSTSSYLNEEKQLGIKLFGKYNSDKDVYMDTKNCWVIESSCIKSVDYVLDREDIDRCSYNSMDNYFCIKNVLKGIEDSELVNTYYDNYLLIYSTKIDKEGQDSDDAKEIRKYTASLSMDEVYSIINNTPKDISEPLISFLAQHTAERKMKITNEVFLRWLAGLCIRYNNNLYNEILLKQKRGY